MPYKNERLETYKKFLYGKTASVIGVGISNIPLIKFLIKNGVKVTARDKRSIEEISSNPAFDKTIAESENVRFVTGENYLKNIKEEIIFKSPGVRFDKPEITEAYNNGSLVTSEMEAFLSLCPSKIITVTGSNGKTTTTSLVAQILRNAGKKVWLGGNIGTPLLQYIEEILPEDFTVLELSSFQLHTVNRFENPSLPFAKLSFPDVGIITNISPNHLDWHTDMDEYADSKKAVFKYIKKGGVFVTNRQSDEYCEKFAQEARDAGINVRTFSAYDGVPKNGAGLSEDGYICLDGQKIISASEMLLPGFHNVENLMAAMLAVKDFVPAEAFVKTAHTFTGVEHRLQLIAEHADVKFYNSSIDSSPSRTAAALSCFDESYNGKINIILGGYDKHIPFDTLAKPICEKKCRAFITGATADKIYEAISSYENYNPNETWLVKCPCFDAAVSAACSAALPGDVVLLSPACASFDEFSNFEQRGKRFAELVKAFISE